MIVAIIRITVLFVAVIGIVLFGWPKIYVTPMGIFAGIAVGVVSFALHKCLVRVFSSRVRRNLKDGEEYVFSIIVEELAFRYVAFRVAGPAGIIISSIGFGFSHYPQYKKSFEKKDILRKYAKSMALLVAVSFSIAGFLYDIVYLSHGFLASLTGHFLYNSLTLFSRSRPRPSQSRQRQGGSGFYRGASVFDPRGYFGKSL